MMIRALVIAISVFALISCSSKSKNREAPKAEPTQASSEKKGPEWTYSGAFGPKFWGDLDPSYVLCKEGQHQSPIDLIWKKPAKPNPFNLMYSDKKVSIVDTGNNIRLNVASGNSIKMRNSIYNLQQVHFHTPSEHLISGKSFPAEIHFVHQNDNGFMAIVGVLVKEGKSNPVAEQIIKNLPPAKNASNDIAEALDLQKLMPEIQTLYNYAGSLTSPPCSEGVNWIVFNTPVEFSAEQIAAIKNRYPMNNRPVQPLNDRVMVNY